MKLIDSAHLRRLLSAGLLAVAATLGGSVIGEPATACAAPKNLDVDAYTSCAKQAEKDFVTGGITAEQMHADFVWCCVSNGGMWNDDEGTCTSPPAEQTGSQPGLPGAIDPGAGVATQNPPPPPPVVRNPGVAPRPGVIAPDGITPAPVG